MKNVEENKFDVSLLVQRITNKNKLKKYITFLIGIFILALSFSVFYAPYNVINGGTTGLSLIFREWLGIDASLFIGIVSLALLVLGFVYLGFSATMKAIIGTILYPLCIYLTEKIYLTIGFNSSSMLLIVIYGGILSGIGTGLILKTGFSNGGFTIIYQIMNKYLKMSIGTAAIISNLLILFIGAYVFGIGKILYSIIAIYISSVVTDRVIIGVSKSKTFYIVTEKKEEVKQLIIDTLGHTATIIEGSGGYSHKKNKIIMATIPTKEYFLVKEVIQEIDKKAFFLITDTYEVEGGK